MDTIVIEIYRGDKLIRTKHTISENYADDYVAFAEECGYRVVQYIKEAV